MNLVQGNTTRFQTHGEWCAHLFAKGCLDPDHARCANRDDDRCVASKKYSVDEARESQRYADVAQGIFPRNKGGSALAIVNSRRRRGGV